MRRVEIKTERLRLALLPGLGAAVAGLWRRSGSGWSPVLRPTPEKASSFLETSMYLLAPWSNRVRDGRFRFAGREQRLHIDWPQERCAIHGLVKNRAWEILERTPVSAWLQTDSRWQSEDEENAEDAPFIDHFHARVGYELTEHAMTARIELRNAGSVTMPCGVGFHPHFAAPAGTTLRLNLDARYPAVRCLPTGPPAPDEITEALRAGAPTDTLELDDCFLGSADGATIAGLHGGVRLSCSRSLTHTVIYAPGKGEDFVCVEPVTMANDGFNLLGKGWRDGVRELKPGDTLIASMTITLTD